MLQVSRLTTLAAVAAATLVLSGCTSFQDYVHNGFKVGPNYGRPPAPVAEHWIDASDVRVQSEPEVLCHWWQVFGDPTLNRLINDAYRQNLTLREAGCRVLQARAEVGIATGNLFPQQQAGVGSFRRSGGAGASFADQWSTGFNLAWELDFWGRFRRAIDAADARLDASVEDYDQVLVTLLGDVAANYTLIRTYQDRIGLLQANVELQRRVLSFIEKRFRAKAVSALDLDQATSNLAQTEAGIPLLETELRIAANRLCILMGMPPVDLRNLLGLGPIPTAPPDVVIGIPAELLRRRPDVRRAERLTAAQAEMIGIAEADLYPAFSIDGTLGYQARNFSDLFTSRAFNGSIGPSFRWNLLNYGRILNEVRFQEAYFQELVIRYQRTVLEANEEVENGLVTFLRAQRRTKLLETSVEAAKKAVKIVVLQYEKGAVDFNRYATIEQSLVQQQDTLAQAQGQIAQGLIQVYRALGGGWEIRLMPAVAPLPAVAPEAAEPALP
jgi:NodT family efflux transporter outer membrane factor (OMF) lipoprotein